MRDSHDASAPTCLTPCHAPVAAALGDLAGLLIPRMLWYEGGLQTQTVEGPEQGEQERGTGQMGNMSYLGPHAVRCGDTAAQQG